MIHKLSELLGTVKTKTTLYHPRSDGLVERFNRTLLVMLAMFVSREHDNWDDFLPFMMLAYNTTVHTTTGFTPYRLVFGEECNLPGNLVHRELRPDPPPGDAGTYASWVRQALYEAYDEVRAQQQRATHRQKRNYDSKAVARIPNWKLDSEVLSTSTEKQTVFSMDWTLQNSACTNGMGRRNSGRRRRANILRPHDLKHCAPPDPEPSWPDTARGTSILVSTCAPSTLAPTDIVRSQQTPDSAHQTGSVSTVDNDVRASNTYDQSEDIPLETDTVAVPTSVWDLHDAKCILSMKSDCCIDVKGFRFFTIERLFYALQLLTLGDNKYIRQLAKYTRMDYVRKCVNTRFELA